MPSRVGGIGLARLSILALCACALLAAANPGHAGAAFDDDWHYDLIYTRSGKVFRGLLVAETPECVKFWRIIRSPGRPTRRMFWSYETADIARIERLGAQQHQVLEARVQALDPDHEKQCLEKLNLLPIAWDGQPDGGFSYRSDYFLLVSDAPEEIVRRAAFRLDRIYAALASAMPPRRIAPPTKIVLVRSQKEYHERLASRGLSFLNPAFYDRDRQEIVCACNLERLGSELSTIRREHQQKRERIWSQERALEREYHGNVPLKLSRPLSQQLAALAEVDRANERQFEESSKRFFETLYHEACHAYVSTFVYFKRDRLPCWLQEGLAQIFETAILDGMEFRIGHRDPQRVERLRNAGRRAELPGLVGLLCSTSGQFIAGHAQDKAATDSYYLSAWALTHYLVFDRELLGTPEFDVYIAALANGADPVAAFEQLVGEPPAQFLKGMPTELRLDLNSADNSNSQSRSSTIEIRSK